MVAPRFWKDRQPRIPGTLLLEVLPSLIPRASARAQALANALRALGLVTLRSSTRGSAPWRPRRSPPGNHQDEHQGPPPGIDRHLDCYGGGARDRPAPRFCEGTSRARSLDGGRARSLECRAWQQAFLTSTPTRPTSSRSRSPSADSRRSGTVRLMSSSRSARTGRLPSPKAERLILEIDPRD